VIDIIINNQKQTVPKTYTIYQACQQANITIPRFCYHDKLSIAGNCRMCLVEIEKSPKPVASCATPIIPNMKIFTDSPLVKKARESVIELLLINHPLDCPICDQGGECDLQEQTLDYGSDRSRYFFHAKRTVEDKEVGPIIKTIMTRCIHCTRCLRFASEIAGIEILGATGRGQKTEIGTYINKLIKTELSGNLVDLCPVGALTSKPYAFISRNWELKKYESFDFSDAIGSNIIIYTRNFNTNKTKFNSKNTNAIRDEILRILPKQNDDINEEWISDKTRYFFDGIKSNRNYNVNFENFLTEKKEINYTWENLINYFIYILSKIKMDNKKNVVVILNNILDVRDIYFFNKFLLSLGIHNLQYSDNFYNMVIDTPNDYEFSSTIQNIDTTSLLMLINLNPQIEASILNARIRKNYSKKNIIIVKIGAKTDNNYPTLNIGLKTGILQYLAEGKTLFCKKLRSTKNLIAIQGTSIFQRYDSLVLTNIIKHLKSKITKNNNFNILHNNISLINLNALGISTGIRSSLYLKKTIKHFNLGLTINTTNDIKKLNINSFINFSTHETDSSKISVLNFPIKTPFEKNSIIINTEGRILNLPKIISFIKNIKSLENISKIASLFLNIKNENVSKDSLIEEFPCLKYLKIINKKFNIKINFKKLNKTKENFYVNSILNYSIKNFYKTDLLSLNSKTMSECSLLAQQSVFA